MKDFFKIILRTTLLLALIVIAGLAVCAFLNDNDGVEIFMIMVLVCDFVCFSSVLAIKYHEIKENDNEEKIKFMQINHLCPSNCKYIVNGKCIATECKRKLGEYEDDDTETS